MRLGAELGSAATAARLDDQAAGTGRHSLAETVLLGAAALVGLVRTLHKAANDTRRRASVRRDASDTCAVWPIDPSIPAIPTFIPRVEALVGDNPVDSGGGSGE